MIYEDLKNKKVLITGSSSGIGQAAAIMFAKQGAFVGVHYFQTKQGAEETLAEVKKHSDGCLLCADVRDENQVNKMVKQFVDTSAVLLGKSEAAGGGIDILINNAGTMIGRQSFEQGTVEHHNNVYATNVLSVFLVTRAALPYLKKAKGCIVNLGSIAGHTGGGGGSGMYAGAKAAVATETIAMAAEFAPYGIRVNSVLPGMTETRFHQQYSTPDRVKKNAAETPLKRNATADDIAKAILFLSSNEASGFITGEYIAVNGGSYMRV